MGDDTNLSPPFDVRFVGGDVDSIASSFPADLSTSGGVPSATITRSSVVGTITSGPTASPDNGDTNGTCHDGRRVNRVVMYTMVAGLFVVFVGFGF